MAESSDTKFLWTGKSEGMALSGGLHTHLPTKDIEKKEVHITEQHHDAKKNCAKLILIL